MRTSGHLRKIAAVAAAALLATSCGGGGGDGSDGPGAGADGPAGVADSVVEAAKDEGNVVFYSAYNAELSDDLAQAFQDRYGITVEVVRQASADLNARYAAEAEAGAVVADVLWQPDDVFADAATDSGWLAELDGDELDNVASVADEDRTPTTVTVLKQPWGIAYNTELLDGSDVPASWQDLAEGATIDGGILFADPANSVSTAAVYDFWLESFGESFFADLRANQDVRIADSVSNAIQQVGGGEFAAFGPAPMSTVANARETGAPVEIVIPDETTGFPMMASISEDAPHPNAARLFLDFLLTEQGQQIAVSDIAIPVVAGVESAVDEPAGYVPSDNRRTAERLDELVRLLGS